MRTHVFVTCRKYYIASSAATGTKFSDRLAKMTEGQTTLMKEIETAILSIEKQSKPHERRLLIDKCLSKVGWSL